jgi:hypothetical protein
MSKHEPDFAGQPSAEELRQRWAKYPGGREALEKRLTELRYQRDRYLDEANAQEVNRCNAFIRKYCPDEHCPTAPESKSAAQKRA